MLPKVAGKTPLIDEHEAARQLGLEPATLRRWRWAGKGPKYRKLGSAVRYSSEDISDFLAASARRSTSDPGREDDKNEQ